MNLNESLEHYLPQLRKAGTAETYGSGGTIVPVHQKVLRDVADLLEQLQAKLRDGKSHICAISHEHRGCAWCRAEDAESKLDAAEKRAEDYAGRIGEMSATSSARLLEIKDLQSRLHSSKSLFWRLLAWADRESFRAKVDVADAPAAMSMMTELHAIIGEARGLLGGEVETQK